MQTHGKAQQHTRVTNHYWGLRPPQATGVKRMAKHYKLKPRHSEKLAYEYFPEFKKKRFLTMEQAVAANPNEADWQAVEIINLTELAEYLPL